MTHWISRTGVVPCGEDYGTSVTCERGEVTCPICRASLENDKKVCSACRGESHIHECDPDRLALDKEKT